MLCRTLLFGLLLRALAVKTEWIDPSILDACSGYTLTNERVGSSTFTADLVFAGECSAFGEDIEQLSLLVEYEADTRIHLKITDALADRYEVPESVFPRPRSHGNTSVKAAAIQFNYTENPFSFSIHRTSTSEVLFSTASHPLIFEPQFLRVKTSLPSNPNIYGLGEHTLSFRLPEYNTTRTMWSRDAYGIPEDTNLYGNHPIYFEHRTTGTHGVFLLNSNGMDIKLNDTDADGATLEYNVIGGVLDFYFLAGSETSPIELTKQYAEIVGTPAEVPYWSFGLHQCRFNYTDFVDVAGVITNYSASSIPLESMWVDIDYMEGRKIFTVDPDYFPMDRMREVVDYLHDHDQKFILMTDPAVALLEGYGPYDRGTGMDIWMKHPNGSASIGLVWPGVTVYPDWFHPDIQVYWNNEFGLFYSPVDGLDIDGAWIDMNEPANFCVLPCEDPYQQAKEQALPPPRVTLPPNHNALIFANVSRGRRDRRDLLTPQYAIDNAAGDLSSKTSWTNATHANGLVEYDTHNLYGTMMSSTTREALLNRRPGLRPFVITRPTFAGAGAKVGKWLGDNMSRWEQYRFSIAGMLGFASIYQVPMVGSDICGFAEDTTERLCARWATLGGFYPFMRNHNADTSISQEFYRWDLVAEAARNVLDMRYRLIDYMYTAFHQASLDGTPVLQPLWYQYPNDTDTYSIDLQFFYGDAILVSPVTEENSTSVDIYLPDDVFYDFKTYEAIAGNATNVTLSDIDFTSIPVYIRGGTIVPLRIESAMTTAELREKDFELIVAIGTDGTAAGSLYLDDGVSLMQEGTTLVSFTYAGGLLVVDGTFGYATDLSITQVRLLGVSSDNATVESEGGSLQSNFDEPSGSLVVPINRPLTGGFSLAFTT